MSKMCSARICQCCRCCDDSNLDARSLLQFLLHRRTSPRRPAAPSAACRLTLPRSRCVLFAAPPPRSFAQCASKRPPARAHAPPSRGPATAPSAPTIWCCQRCPSWRWRPCSKLHLLRRCRLPRARARLSTRPGHGHCLRRVRQARRGRRRAVPAAGLLRRRPPGQGLVGAQASVPQKRVRRCVRAVVGAAHARRGGRGRARVARRHGCAAADSCM
jgi:hypothetical protein